MKKCKICGSYSSTGKHNGKNCTSYWQQKVIEEIGEEGCKCFKNKYRIAKDRTCNPNDKRYCYYGRFEWGFDDFTHFYKTCFSKFKEAWEDNPDDVSIDRIDNKIGYRPDNVRFITMKENIDNRDNIIPLKAFNIKTGEVVISKSINDLARKGIGSSSSIHNFIKSDREVFKKVWKIELI